MSNERSRVSVFRRVTSALVNILIAAAVAWTTGEILLRLFRPQLTGPLQGEFDRDLGVLPKKNTVTWRAAPPFYTYSARHDSAGRRVVVHQPERPDLAALFLGDSFTYGAGVSDEDTFSSVTQGILLNRGLKVRVINAGNPGIGTDFELRYWQLRGLREKPRIVDLFFFENDFTDNRGGHFFDVLPDGSLRPKTLQESAFRRAVESVPAHDYLLSHSHVAALLRSLPLILRVEPRLPNKNDIPEPQPVPIAYQRLEQVYLSNLAQSVRDSGACFHIFYVPSGKDIAYFRSRGKAAPDEAALAEVCLSLGFSVTSFTPLIAGTGDRLETLYYGEGHWKPRTHALVSPMIADSVQADVSEAATGR
ncbi:MAG TPA: hypothetical protein VLW65_15720 [Bryobacteraceae bacterium]|nr:hypothetical protein [Bryobacteraceae bacterium]